MSKYRGNSNNTDNRLLWGMGVAGVVFLLVKGLHLITNVQDLNEAQKNEQDYLRQQNTLLVVKDSITGKLDTMTRFEYQQRQQSVYRLK